MSHIKLPDLPYAQDALEPHISKETLGFHHGKHHATYVNNLNNMIPGTAYEGKDLEDIIRQSAKDTAGAGVFNNAAQIWNHTFYWHCMAPNGGGQPSDGLLAKITEAFGSFDEFKAQFKQAALTQFGSGWAWLVSEGGKLKITKTGNAETPLTSTATPLLTCDVWEHAYYLDYQNKRPDYVDTFLNHLVNWAFVEENLSAA